LLPPIALLLTARYAVPFIASKTLARGIAGKDINKQSTTSIPEAVGLASGIVFVATLAISQLDAHSHTLRADINAAVHSISLMMLLGFADDVLDIPWRYKIMLPFVAALPLVTSYSGGTGVVVPIPISNITGLTFIELGIVYRLYMMLLAVFCTNSINILAGVNGLEAGQTIVIAIAIVIHNIIEITTNGGVGSIAEAHWFSLQIMIPFIFTTLALLYWNWYPSKVFVGDTFTLYSGMTLAVAGILGHFSKTLLLFFTPQIINFVYSLPQLFGFVPCPRHRLPKLDTDTGRLKGVKSNMNLLNLVLLILGPLKERDVCIALLIFQAICCAGAFVVRYYLASLFY
jgi:UDP-N-acetylglucosamine--dolichyl-phosphate N-acetylglucosaminephosphotransferase